MSWSSGDLGQIGADDRWRWHVPWRWHGRSAVDRDGCCCTKSYCARRLGLQMFDLMNKHEPLNPSQDGFFMKYRRAGRSKKNMTHMMVSKWTCGYISTHVVKQVDSSLQSGPLLVIWNYNPYKWSNKWVTGIFATRENGAISPYVTCCVMRWREPQLEPTRKTRHRTSMVVFRSFFHKKLEYIGVWPPPRMPVVNAGLGCDLLKMY